MKINTLNFLIGGQQGEGVDRPGALFSRLCAREGLKVHSTAEYYSVIKGYHVYYQMRIAEIQPYAHSNDFDLVLALDKDSTERHTKNIVPGGALIYDPTISGAEVTREGVLTFPVPLKALAKEKAGLDLAKNMVGLGAVVALLDYPVEDFLKLVEGTFGSKGGPVVQKNLDAARAGYDYIKEHFNHAFSYQLKKVESPPLCLLNGNEVVSLGAIKAGCKFVAEYPMTPSSSILSCMAKHARQFDISVNHVEDELSAINMAVGAGYAGVRALVGTSGGGFALMTEAIGLAGMIEAPVVVAECQRPGPSTGLPTRTGQGDLRQVMHASQGDFPKIVLSPGTHEESFFMTFEAFNLAEVYQCPVILLCEKYLSEGRATLPFLPHDHLKIDRGKMLTEAEIAARPATTPGAFLRYKTQEDGICERTIPGQKGGAHTASSYEHREDGYFTEEIDECNAIHARRMKKMETLEAQLPQAILEGPPDADTTLVCWGGTYGPAREATELLAQKGLSANLLHIKYLLPLQPGVGMLLEKSRRPILVEGNITAQLGGLIAEKTGITLTQKLLNWSGRPFTAAEIAQGAESLLAGSFESRPGTQKCEKP